MVICFSLTIIPVNIIWIPFAIWGLNFGIKLSVEILPLNFDFKKAKKRISKCPASHVYICSKIFKYKNNNEIVNKHNKSLNNIVNYSEFLASPLLYSSYFPFTSVFMISQYHSQNFLCFSLLSFISWVLILYFFSSHLSHFSTFGCLLHALVYPPSIDFKLFLWFISPTCLRYFSYGTVLYFFWHSPLCFLGQ